MQTLVLYSALLHSSVNMVMVWVTLAPLVVDAVLGAVLNGRSLPQEVLPMLAVAGGAGCEYAYLAS